MIYDAAVVGLGPNGLRVLACLTSMRLNVIGFERGLIGHTIRRWPDGAPVVGEQLELSVHGTSLARYCGDVECDRDAYVKYLENVQREFELNVHDKEEVISISRADASGPNSQHFLITSRSRRRTKLTGHGFSHGDHHERILQQYRANFVILAIGAFVSPRPLSAPGAWRNHVVSPEDVTMKKESKYRGKRALVVGTGLTAWLVVKALSVLGASKVVLCSSAGSVAAALGRPADFFADVGLSSWACARYGVTEADVREDAEWCARWTNSTIYTELVALRRGGVLHALPYCHVHSIQASRAHLSTLGQGLRALVADVVVVAKGMRAERRLTKSMDFGIKEADVATGETAIQGVFAVGFDPPGSGNHHAGTLPDGRSVYDNWLCWGHAGAATTCREVARRTRQMWALRARGSVRTRSDL